MSRSPRRYLPGLSATDLDQRAKRRTTVQPKFFFSDVGVFRSLRPSGPLDRPAEISGAALEGLLAQHLRAWIEYSKADCGLWFWRTRGGSEVDFVVNGADVFVAFEVKHTAEIRPADLRSLKAFGEDYPEASLRLLYRGSEVLEIGRVRCVPFADYVGALDPRGRLDGQTVARPAKSRAARLESTQMDPSQTASESSDPPRRFWTRHLRREIQFLLDLGVLGGAFVLAYLLRFEFQIPTEHLKNLVTQWPMVVLLQFTLLVTGGIYAFIWRYVGMAEILTFLRAATYSAVPLLVLRFTLPDALRAWRVPISVTIMDTVLAFGGILALRVLRRGIYERFERQAPMIAGPRREGRRQRVLFVGAGQAGLMAAREILAQSETDLEVVGFIDDDRQKQGSRIYGVRVLGTTADLPRLVEEEEIDRAIITMVKVERDVLRRLMETLNRLGVSVQIMPALYEILEGRVNVSRFREVRIEDVLGREAVKLDEDEISQFLADRTVMVTGAGGSIGSELARQVARFEPRRLLLVERSEAALFEIDRELRKLWEELELVPVVADVADEARMRGLLAEEQPQILLHAAAHKHVPLMERNRAEAIRNNSLGSYALGRLAGEAGVEAFVLISTDKAVRPTSVMGATKRLAEVLLSQLEGRYPTRFSTVRFGNVLGSSGSVIPIFRRQIEEGGPVTVTDPAMVRFFMTIPEASQLVLQAAAMGRGGELFVLDMGEPVKILDLARDMIRLAGLEPGVDIEIEFTGVRPGEKLYEELNYEGEDLQPTRHPKITAGRMETQRTEAFDEVLGLLWGEEADRREMVELREEIEGLLECPTRPIAG